jgi:hypothetical protein
MLDRLDDVAARLFLLVERYRVFQVEHDDVGRNAPRLLDEAEAGAGHGQLRPVEARMAGPDRGEAHDILPTGDLGRMAGRAG